MPKDTPTPVVAVPVSFSSDNPTSTPLHSTGDKYLRTIIESAGAMPVLIPALGDALDIGDLVSRIDGLMLTGGRANVEPHHYGGPPFPDDEFIDPGRDATVLPLIRACIDHGVPIFGICRGIQEINVALGGSLHYRIHLLPGKIDHRMPRDVQTREERMGRCHPIALTPGGLFEELVKADEVTVNSLHGQGIDRCADGIEIEAMSPDGVIEGVTVNGAKTFTVGVQWHAEWKVEENQLAERLFETFGDAMRQRAQAKDR